MADAELHARLESHSKAFEGLMALIPAKYYYGEDNDDQWQRKKQTKEQKRQAKKAKLEPGAYKSALDVHKEREQNELKRKRDLQEEGSDSEHPSDVAREKPREGLKSAKDRSSKKAKVDAATIPDGANDELKQKSKGDKRREKRERKKAKVEKRKAKLERKKAKSAQNPKTSENPSQESEQLDVKADGSRSRRSDKSSEEKTTVSKAGKDAIGEEQDDHQDEEEDGSASEVEEDIAKELETLGKMDFSGLADDDIRSEASNSSAAETTEGPPVFDTPEQHSSASSTSSILPLSKSQSTSSLPKQSETRTKSSVKTQDGDQDQEDKAPSPRARMKIINMPEVDQEVLRERLAAKLAVLRAARNADGLDGKPARNRQELIEARRRKEERRKAHKKELRAQAKEQERTAEAEAARLRGTSGSPLWSPSAISSSNKQAFEDSFSFGKVEFDDGAHMDSSGSHLLEGRKRKGPSDPKTALEAAQKKSARINALDQDKRADIEEKDRWLNAKKRVHGERVRDDVSLLKKTLKRKDKVKHKSEREWDERIEGVKKGKEMRQKKRDDNLAKRREEKGASRPKGRFGIKFNPGGKKAGPAKKRPGFEGTFKTPARQNA